VLAAPAEYRAARGAFGLGDGVQPSWDPIRADGRFDLIQSGVGKAQSAAATAFACARERYAGVLSVGIGGLLPETGVGMGRFDLGSVVLASRSVFADEGAEMPDGFAGLHEMGFDPSPSGAGEPVDPAWRVVLEPLVDDVGVIATVSTCAGTDRRAAEVARRTGAVVEAMEGAAVGAAVAGPPAASLGGPRPAFAEVRIVSNTTGNRDRQRWDLDRALGAMVAFLGRLRDGEFGLGDSAG